MHVDRGGDHLKSLSAMAENLFDRFDRFSKMGGSEKGSSVAGGGVVAPTATASDKPTPLHTKDKEHKLNHKDVKKSKEDARKTKDEPDMVCSPL